MNKMNLKSSTNSEYAQTGWQFIDGNWYYFYSNGQMAKDCWIDGYYITSNGIVAETTWRKDENGWWYQYADGSYVKGWAYISGNWYYFDNNGYMQTDWQLINGKWYYFYTDESRIGIMATNCYIDDNWLTSCGIMSVPSWQEDINGWWYSWGDGTYAKNGTITIIENGEKKNYTFDEQGYLVG